jgi:uncharacterized protein YbjQ (UPF0145 family)
MPSCKVCGNPVSFLEAIDGRCAKCHFDARRRTSEGGGGSAVETSTVATPPISDADLSRITLCTDAAFDLKVATRIDIVTAEFAVGMGLLTDVFNAWRDVFGGRSKSYQNTLKDARRTVLQELRREAHLVGADAVLGVSRDYSEISGGGKSMLFLVASGTAVKLAQ